MNDYAFTQRIWWTWDHRTNWTGEPAGAQSFGCDNPYLRGAERFLADYRAAIDRAAAYGINGIVIWGFLRDSHGGIAAARQLCDYAVSKNVRILSGVGTSVYGGFYYEGEHEFSARTWLARHPDLRSLGPDGRPENSLCPAKPENQRWLRDGVRWLFETFAIGGLNLEYGDYKVCHCPDCVASRAADDSGDPDFYKDMVRSILPTIEAARLAAPDAWITYATYTGFDAAMRARLPGFVARLPEAAICQWTATYLLDSPEDLSGVPGRRRKKADWPDGLGPPTRRNAVLWHQGGPWGVGSGPSVCIQLIAEVCRKAARAGIDGLVCYGEVGDWCPASRLNYTALEYFARRPEGDLASFATEALAPRLFLGDEEEARTYLAVLVPASRELDALRRDEGTAFGAILRAQRDARGEEGLVRLQLWEFLYHRVIDRILVESYCRARAQGTDTAEVQLCD